MFDAELVGFFITLCAGGADGWAFACVEHTELDASGIGIEAHGTAEGVDFTDDVTFGESADGGVARHGTDGIQVLGEHGDATAESGGGESGFDTGMACADDEDIVVFGVLEHGGYLTFKL
jgi:hypothetical protein